MLKINQSIKTNQKLFFSHNGFHKEKVKDNNNFFIIFTNRTDASYSQNETFHIRKQGDMLAF